MENNKSKTCPERSRRIKIIFLTVIFFALFGLAQNSQAAEYYVSPTDSLAAAVSQLQPGDTLILKDGTYYQSLNVTVSGTAGNPITIEAEHDGQVIIDGQNTRIPCEVYNKSYVILEGLVCKNSNDDVVYLHGYSTSNITLKRITAFNAGNNNNAVFSLWGGSSYLIEDCAGWGNGRKMLNVMETSHATIRRFWGRWTTYSGGGGNNTITSIYGSDDTIAENVVLVNGNLSQNVSGFSIWANYYNNNADRNKILGTVVYNMTGLAYSVSSAQHRIEGNILKDVVSINCTYDMANTGDASLTIENATAHTDTSGNWGFYMYDTSTYTKDGDYIINTTLKNSAFSKGTTCCTALYVQSGDVDVGTLTNTYNNIYNFTTDYSGKASKGIGEIDVNPSYDTNTYGEGAYLIAPVTLKGKGENGADIGAEVLYRYQDGVLTGTALWPWPMEERICNETGYSVTYENSCTNGGGLWKTLDGVYFDTTPPASPTGLMVN
ncbi:MAG: chondroitinase-B domain-containing protein [Candidatus Gottesmanbacteria bacterium]